jgi:hypothetical protein
MNGVVLYYSAPSVYETTGATKVLDLNAMEQHLPHPRASTKDAARRWNFVEYRDSKRCLDGFMRAHGMLLDQDCGIGLEPLERAFAPYYGLIYSTGSGTETIHCWRIGLIFDRFVESVADFDRVWRYVASRVEAVGGKPEYSARSAAHVFAVPFIPPSGFYVARILRGAFLNVDEALAAIPKPEPLPIPAANIMTDSYSHIVERAAKYLSTMPGAISGSGGHATTFRAATKMVRGFNLDSADALRLLVEIHNPLCVPQWSMRELEHKIKQAMRSRLPAGFLAEKTRAA